MYRAGKALCLLLVSAGLVVPAPATPAAADTSLALHHSAASGELERGRLTLHGVSRRLAWFDGGGSSGYVRVTRAHRGLFMSARQSHTALLHVSGRGRAAVPALRVSQPRYDARRRTVSYRARPLVRQPAGTRAEASQRLPRSFGPATLAIVPAQIAGDGNECDGNFINSTGTQTMRMVSFSAWETDVDVSTPLPGAYRGPGELASWASNGGPFRGCSVTVTWQVAPDSPQSPLAATLTFTITWPWGQFSPTGTCTSSNPRISCPEDTAHEGLFDGEFLWQIRAH